MACVSSAKSPRGGGSQASQTWDNASTSQELPLWGCLWLNAEVPMMVANPPKMWPAQRQPHCRAHQGLGLSPSNLSAPSHDGGIIMTFSNHKSHLCLHVPSLPACPCCGSSLMACGLLTAAAPGKSRQLFLHHCTNTVSRLQRVNV